MPPMPPVPPPLCLKGVRTRLAVPTACFSTSAARFANPPPKRKGTVAPPKRGTRTLNVKKGKSGFTQDTGKRPVQGERRAQRKRIVLTNDNALEVPSLKDLSRSNALDAANEGRVMGFPADVVDALRAVDAFKPTQGWSLFRRPAALMRKETMQLVGLMKEVEGAAKDGQQRKTIRRVLSGDRMSGKSTLLLQGLAVATLRGWVVVNLPDAQDIVNAHTDYAPLPKSSPPQYTQDTYTANLLHQILKANGAILEGISVTTNPKLPLPLPANPTLKNLVELGMVNPEVSWPVFTALWQELLQPGRPPVMLAIDGLSHIMRESEYMSAEFTPIHAHDLTLVRHFVDHLSGQKSLPNGGVVLAATSRSNAPTSPALDHCVKVAEALQNSPDNLPRWDLYRNVDGRVMEVLKGLQDPKTTDLDVIQAGGLTKEEARSIIEYYAESGMLRHQVDDGFVAEKWSLAGMGNIGELERASVRLRM
ncbi:hypothetical protein P280DRAFT_442361 [Massarina eburnea CBS 473.64]|uniref:Small ribosomal subunit protein mS29 n=1 Tax=Massarina eburnea CBS 473.64 TaxID=1395130 RepID=A0A6A6SCU7_9PLEO|nr:hypothetical protein P280DRAFT_442361 [Massarina eburnea CBS 473.64]